MKILIIEDDSGLAELITEKVEECGFESTSVNSGIEALKWLEDHEPDLMILDYNLPKMNGKELIVNIQNADWIVPPFIVSTGQGDEHIAVEMMKLGAKDYLIKNGYFLEILPRVIQRVSKEIENEKKLKRAEEAIRESRERYLSLFDNMLDGIYRSTHDGKFVDVNPAMVRMFGYSSKEEMLQVDIINDLYFAPEERESNILGMGQEEIEIYRMRRKDGSEIWVEDHGHYVHDEQGRVLYHDGILRDITERKQTEQEQEKMLAQLTQAQKMESVGRLAGGVAHDFNNMLGVILGHAEMALMQLDPELPLHSDLKEIQRAANRSANLTRQLLAFARKQTIAPKVLDLNETMAGMLSMLRRLVGENISLVWIPGAEVWPVRMDPSQIDQILANLCVNARDAIADVGKLTIETGNSTFDADFCAKHAGFVPGEYIRLAVSDSGHGMDKQTLTHIFEPFFTTKGVGEGTGLGLATIYGIVKQNNGLVNVYSEPGLGTTFNIYLPRHLSKTGQVPEKGPSDPAVRGHETILLVEDEPAILNMITMMLGRLGYTVVAAGTADEAMRLAREYAGEIHLLLTDVVMPEMNGRDLAEKMLTIYPHLKCLFMSGYTANVIAHHGVLDEGVYFIQKPFSVNVLSAKVREVLEEDPRLNSQV